MKFFLSLLLSLHVAFGASFVYPNFKQCYNQNLKSLVYFGDTKAVAITKHYAVAYLKKKPMFKYIKYDPYLNLYLFYSPKVLNPVKLKKTNKLNLGDWIASISENSIFVGNFSKRGYGIDSLFEQNSKVEPNSIITCLCCEAYGIGVGDHKFIPTELIKRFLHSQNIFYGDIGVKFKKIGKNIVVSHVKKSYVGNKIKVGDIIKKADNKQIKSLGSLENMILFGAKNKTLEIEFLRKNVMHREKFKRYKKQIEKKSTDSFLGRKGMFFDKSLHLVKIERNSFASKSGLKIGDKLLQINRKNVKSNSDVDRILSKHNKKEAYLLFDRNSFDFFIKVAF